MGLKFGVTPALPQQSRIIALNEAGTNMGINEIQIPQEFLSGVSSHLFHDESVIGGKSGMMALYISSHEGEQVSVYQGTD